jgi:hypothetical protein
MIKTYGVRSRRRSFVVVQRDNEYRFVWWLFDTDGQYQKATTIALIGEPADTLIVTDRGKAVAVNYTPQHATGMVKALPEWTLTRYIYFFKVGKPWEIWDCKMGKLLTEKERAAVTSAIEPDTITSLLHSLQKAPKLWGQNFGAADAKKK